MRATYNGKEGMIDGQNNIIIPFEYSNIGNFYNVGSYNMAWVEQDGKYGIYNIDGTVIQPWDIEKAYVMNEKISSPLSTRGLSIKPTTNGALWTYRTTAFRKPSTTKS